MLVSVLPLKCKPIKKDRQKAKKKAEKKQLN